MESYRTMDPAVLGHARTPPPTSLPSSFSSFFASPLIVSADLTANDGGPHAWDEGWAFYTGSIEGTVVGGSADGGQMLYALAEKRCENFGTCNANGVAEVNTDILTLWTAGQQNLLAAECAQAATAITNIAPLMAVPLIQGVLR